MIFRSCLITASQPITTLHPLSARTSISPSALQIRPYSALKSLSAILYLLKCIFISRSISVCWLLASDLKIPMQTPSVDETGPITEGDFSLADGLIMNNVACLGRAVHPTGGPARPPPAGEPTDRLTGALAECGRWWCRTARPRAQAPVHRPLSGGPPSAPARPLTVRCSRPVTGPWPALWGLFRAVRGTWQ